MSQPDTVIAGRYLLLDRVGVGGMGQVWRAHDERLDREVAVKQLHSQPGADPDEAEVWNARAMREGRITARLSHPHAVPVFDVVEHAGQPCLIMQYFPSRSLAEVLVHRGRLPVPEVARLGADVASALAAAHQVGIVHRDIKPANVLIADDGTAKITDFGIAHARGDVSLTSTGLLTGTPAYLAPEVAKGARATPASDVFSLGATLYAALEGQPPFGTGKNPMALLHQVAAGNVTPPRYADALTPLLMRMLRVDPADRPAMAQVARSLSQPLDGGTAAVAPTLVGVAAAEGGGSAATRVATGTQVPPSAGPSGVESLWPSQGRPPTEPPEGAGHGRRRALFVVVALLVLGAVVALGLRALGGQGSPDARRATTAGSPTPSTGGSSRPPATTSSPTPSANSEPTRTPSTTAPPAPTAPTSAQLAAAVEDYYALLPGDSDTAWNRLTERYQRTTATNRRTFEAFWGGVDRVRATDVDGSAPDRVDATITYDFDDGRRFVERTRYRLVEDGGLLKIDRSQVLSSVQR
jgi:eukaryotic-like serine/threonine-protein kinase